MKVDALFTVGVYRRVDGVVRADRRAEADGNAREGVVARVADHQVSGAGLEAVFVEEAGDAGRDHRPPVVVVHVEHAR